MPSTVPPIHALRKRLGHPTNQDFFDEVRSFRNDFETSAGTKGGSLSRWRDDKKGLVEMAKAFIKLHGLKYWSQALELDLELLVPCIVSLTHRITNSAY
jgi:hypothetical protein